MNPEHTEPVAVHILRRPPDQYERPQDHPEHEFVGERMLAQADELIERDHRLTPEQREFAHDEFRRFVSALTMNAPVLMLNLSEDTTSEISRAGRATPDVWLHGREYGDWALAFRQYEYGRNGKWSTSTLHYGIWTFLGDIRNGSRRLIVGEEDVHEWLRGRSLATVHMSEPTPFHFARDFNILESMRAGSLPIDYLNLTLEQRQHMGDHVAAAILEDNYHVRHDTEVLEYLLDIQDEEERNTLYHRIADELADELPVTHTDVMWTDHTLDVASGLAERITVIEGQPEGVVLRARAKQILLLAHLYRRRSQMDHDEPEPIPNPERAPSFAPDAEFPPGYELTMFTQNTPNPHEIWRDIDYINHLNDSGESIDALHLTERRAQTVSSHIHNLLMDRSTPLADLQPVFDALEFVFNAQDEAGRRRLYSEILYALSGSLPVRRYSSGDLLRVVSLLEVMLPRFPESLRNYRGDDLRGPAEVAAVIADMYEWRAGFYIQADLTGTGMDEDQVSED